MTRAYTAHGKLELCRTIDKATPTERATIMKQHLLSENELRSWRELYQSRGIEGLMATKVRA